MNDLAKNIILWIVIAVVLLSVFNSFGKSAGSPQALQYSEFLTEVRNGQIQSVIFHGDDSITGQRSGGAQFLTYNPETDRTPLIDLLVDQGIPFDAAPPKKQGFLVQLFIS